VLVTASKTSRPATPRGFYISDGLILVAATALGISLAMLWHEALARDSYLGYSFGGWGTARRTRFSGLALSILITASLTVLALRARWPRPRMWLLARQPGTIACVASSMVVAAQLLALPLDLRTFALDASPFLIAAYYWPPSVSAVVLSSWLVLALGRRWRPGGGDWVEQMGMLVGTCWIGLLPALAVIDRY
jgi:hypothetical protein